MSTWEEVAQPSENDGPSVWRYHVLAETKSGPLLLHKHEGDPVSMRLALIGAIGAVQAAAVGEKAGVKITGLTINFVHDPEP